MKLHCHRMPSNSRSPAARGMASSPYSRRLTVCCGPPSLAGVVRTRDWMWRRTSRAFMLQAQRAVGTSHFWMAACRLGIPRRWAEWMCSFLNSTTMEINAGEPISEAAARVCWVSTDYRWQTKVLCWSVKHRARTSLFEEVVDGRTLPRLRRTM